MSIIELCACMDPEPGQRLGVNEVEVDGTGPILLDWLTGAETT